MIEVNGTPLRRTWLAAALMVGVATLAVGCTSSFDPEQSETFPCAAQADACGAGPRPQSICDSDDCVGDMVCDVAQEASQQFQSNHPGAQTGLCVEFDPNQAPACDDEDGDGYGTNPNDRTLCPACQQGRPRGCEIDCDDTDATVHPGRVDVCNGEDDNCRGGIDEPTPCESFSDCADLEAAESIPEGTQFECEEVSGQKQCVLKGSFQQGSECQMARSVCTNGSYPMLPADCTSSG